MDNFFTRLLEEYGVPYEVRGDEVWYKCPIPGHNNDDVNYSASYSVAKNICNCFVHGGGFITLIMYLTNKTYDEVKKEIKKHKPEIELAKIGAICNSVIDRSTAPILSKSILDRYKKKIHKSYTFKNFTSNVSLIKKLEIGFDEKSNRVTIPLKDKNGNYVLVVKRSISQNAKLRYIYEPKGCEKSDYVYGIDFWDNPDYLIVVEGAKDVIRCMDKGVKNVVAILGSKPSIAQINILRKKTSKIYVALDDDYAGNLGVKVFKRNFDKFRNGLFIFKHPKVTREEILKKYRRDMAEYSFEEINNGRDEAVEYRNLEGLY